jgi:hypothetical protein
MAGQLIPSNAGHRHRTRRSGQPQGSSSLLALAAVFALAALLAFAALLALAAAAAS